LAKLVVLRMVSSAAHNFVLSRKFDSESDVLKGNVP